MDDLYHPSAWLGRHVVRELEGPPALAPERGPTMLEEALRWCARWMHSQLHIRHERELADLSALSWVAWHEPVRGRGLAFMYDWIAGRRREDVWCEALHERYQRALTRLSDRVALRRAGRPSLDFDTSAQVQRYFARCVALDARRLLLGDRRAVADDEIEDWGLPGPADSEDEAAALRVDLGRQSDVVAAHVAAAWCALDHAVDQPSPPFLSRRAREWAMLRHWCDAVPAEGTGKAGALRNEPRRVGERHDARHQVCVGARSRLGAWAAQQGLTPADVLLPAEPDAGWLEGVALALRSWLLPELDLAIGRLPASGAEREALHATLVRGALVRIEALEGTTTEARRAPRPTSAARCPPP